MFVSFVGRKWLTALFVVYLLNWIIEWRRAAADCCLAVAFAHQAVKWIMATLRFMFYYDLSNEADHVYTVQ